MPKRDGRDLARVIATNAERDAVAVEKMAPDPELADDIVGLHAQQAAEKYLKAVLATAASPIGASTASPTCSACSRTTRSRRRRAPRSSRRSRRGRRRPATTTTPTAVLDREAAVELVAAVRAWAQAVVL